MWVVTVRGTPRGFFFLSLVSVSGGGGVVWMDCSRGFGRGIGRGADRRG